MDVALNYFPLPPEVSGDCAGAGFDMPDVPMGRLEPSPDRTQAQAITDSLAAHSPTILTTPTEGALNGMVRYCRQFQADHAPEKCVGVLVTDGLPALLCNTNTAQIAQIAANAYDKVNDAADCVEGAWHFDDDDDPTRIVACPETCATIQSTSRAKVDILLGCQTVVLE